VCVCVCVCVFLFRVSAWRDLSALDWYSYGHCGRRAGQALH